MKSNHFAATTVSLEKKTLERLKRISAKSSSRGDAPHRSVSDLVREAVREYLERGAK